MPVMHQLSHINSQMHDAGLPSGVLNLITGPGAELGQEIARNEDVAGVVFTGSFKAGYEIFKRLNRVKPRHIIA
jgi:acyl-CoA reductase-like NAD-dependent aldehyde dehydrogenase